jgi:RHS repeat-associated protein
VTTAAHDLASIGYDAAGNLTALQRYRETGTLIDNLTYSYPGSSNRLSSVADAINTTSETWDAEDGSFTYDANGNMKTAPAPYSISAVTYDHQNLPISLTRSGTTTTYRYNEAGQRITKRVGTANPEHYILEGATALAVFTRDPSGNPTSWYFNVLAGDKVVGRQPNTGSRRYYHTDLLGSTRSVTQGTTVVESYDFEPWGLLMPGRTLGSGTKEGFTSKERDAETGLDYFGARYYMPALARWGAVDPLAEKHLEWSPYNYVLNNPLALIDPDGRQVTANPGAGGLVWVWRGFRTGAAAGIIGGPAVAIGIGLIETFIGATLYINEPPVPVQPVQLPDATTVAVAPILTTETAAGLDLATLLQVDTKPQEGIYDFPDQKNPGQDYVGQSGNMDSRLKDHTRTGRLRPGTETRTEVKGGKTAREVAEHQKIQQKTGGVPARQSDRVSNKRDPIGPKRTDLLKKGN